jgi:hypothetical protein
MNEIDEEALMQMRERGGTWACYENSALDSSNAGHLQFLQYGPNNTYKDPPPRYPIDNRFGMGWRYLLVGLINLATGQVERSSNKGESRGSAG